VSQALRPRLLRAGGLASICSRDVSDLRGA
jgi:hypothetical protein